MSNVYEVYLDNPFGQRIATLNNFLTLSYVMTVNVPGALVLTLPDSFDLNMLQRDCRIEVWRAVDDGLPALEGGQHWLIRKWGIAYDENGSRTIQIGAWSALDLLRRRMIAYDANTTYTGKSGAADTILTSFVSQNMGSGIVTDDRDGDDTGANISSFVTVSAASGSGPTISKNATRRNLLTVCQEIADASAQDGTYLAFDIIADGNALLFQTFLNWRGTDRRLTSGNPVMFGPEFGNVRSCTVSYDYTSEVTFAIAGGSGQEADRVIATSADSTRLTASPFNRIESFFSDSNTNDSTRLTDSANTLLRENRPRIVFDGSIQDTPGVKYGRDWGLGDYVTVQAADLSFDCRINGVQVKIERGLETIGATLRGEATDD